MKIKMHQEPQEKQEALQKKQVNKNTIRKIQQGHTTAKPLDIKLNTMHY